MSDDYADLAYVGDRLADAADEVVRAWTWKQSVDAEAMKRLDRLVDEWNQTRREDGW